MVLDRLQHSINWNIITRILLSPSPLPTLTHTLIPPCSPTASCRGGLKPIGLIAPNWALHPVLQTLLQVDWEPGPTKIVPNWAPHLLRPALASPLPILTPPYSHPSLLLPLPTLTPPYSHPCLIQ